MKKSLCFRTICVFLLLLMAISSLAVVLGNGKSISTSKYDLNGDGKADKVQVKFTNSEEEYWEDTVTAFTININGKTQTFKELYYYESKIELVDIDKTDKYKEIVISFLSDNDYQDMYIFRWNGSKVVFLGELNGGTISRNYVKFPGDGIIVTYTREDILGTFDRVQKYKVQTKSPWFKAVAQSTYDTLGEKENVTATVKRAFKGYASMKDKNPTIQLKKGDKLERTGTDGKQWVRFKTSAGKTVWIKAATGEYEIYSNIAGYGSMYDYITGIDFYG